MACLHAGGLYHGWRWPGCEALDDELVPGIVLPGVVVVLGWPSPGALAALGPMPAAPGMPFDAPFDMLPVPEVPVELPPAVPAAPPVTPVCDGFVVSDEVVVGDVVPVPVVELAVELPSVPLAL